MLAGQLQGGTLVENVTVKGSVSGGGSDVGGIAGDTVKNGEGNVVVKNCVNYAEITVTMAKPGAVGAAGGIIGATAAGLESLVINCSNHGKVSTTSTFGGGIIGLLRVVSGNTNYKVSGCYNYGDISGAIQVGGIVGGSRDRIENSYTLSTAKINGSAAIDLILDGKATTYIGAIVGRLETSAAIRNRRRTLRRRRQPHNRKNHRGARHRRRNIARGRYFSRGDNCRNGSARSVARSR